MTNQPQKCHLSKLLRDEKQLARYGGWEENPRKKKEQKCPETRELVL